MAPNLPTKRLDLLKDRNDKLSAQLAVQSDEIKRLHRRVAELEGAQEDSQETVLCVNRLWDELNDTIQQLLYKATGEAPCADKDDAHRDENEFLEEINPFLAKLLSSCLADDRHAATTAKRLADVPDIENALRKRMSATMSAATTLLERINSPSTGIEGHSASKESQLAALTSLLRAENNRLRDQALQDSTKIRDLSNSLADREEEFLVAQRKVAQLREAAAAQEASAFGEPGPPASGQTEIVTGADATGSERAQTQQPVDDAALNRLKEHLKQRTAEVEARDVALSKADREIRQLRGKLASERESAARTRQYEADRTAKLSSNLDALDARFRDTVRDRDDLLTRLHDSRAEVERGAAATRRVAGMTTRIAELETALSVARRGRADVEAQLEQLRAIQITSQTAQELAEVVSALEREISMLRESNKKYRAVAQGAEDAVATASEAKRLMEEAQAEVGGWKDRLSEARAEVDALKAERNAAAEREEELRLFVELAHEFLGNERNGEADDLRSQVSSFLQAQANTITQFLAAAASGSQGPSLRELELINQVDALKSIIHVLETRVKGMQSEIDALRSQAASLKEESESFAKEVESVAEAYEAAKEQNARLLKIIASRDEDNVRLMREAAAATRERASAMDDLQGTLSQMELAKADVNLAEERVSALESRMAGLLSDLDAARKEARSVASRADAAVRDLAGAQAAVAAATRDAEAARKEAADAVAAMESEAELVRKERTRAERAEAEAEDLRGRMGKMSRVGSTIAGGTGGMGGDAGLVAECAALRKMVNCNVCHVRMKDRIITKCNHIFCSQCIEANLATRHRKCPGCAERFGAGDVKAFYFT